MCSAQFDFTDEEIRTLPEGHLLSMEIEFSRRCNYRCPYCYAAGNYDYSNELTKDEIRSTLAQAAELGARKIVILGGEPLLYPYLQEMIRFIRSLDMGVEIFTNGSLVTRELAEFFFAENCRLVVKLNTLDKVLHDRLTGHRNSLELSQNALRLLRGAGYDSRPGMLCATTVLSSSNLDAAPELWRYLRERKIAPYFECLTPQGRLLEYRSLLPEVMKVREVFEEIRRIDAEYGFQWESQPPLVGQKCLRHKYSCVVNSFGDVTPCVGLTEVIGNVRKTPLKEILTESLIIRKLKDHRANIKSPCRECDKAEECYGCRGTAWQLTGDYLAADPTCWRNLDQLDRIDRLPFDARMLIPHRPPMAMAETLTKITDHGGETVSRIHEDNPFLDENGVLDSAALIELAAQSAAALDSFMHEKKVSPGMLAGVTDFMSLRSVRKGDAVTIRFEKEAEFMPWHIIRFEAFNRNGEKLAQGVMKLCILES